MAKVLSKEELFSRLDKHNGYLHGLPHIKVPRYFNDCYDYIMDRFVDKDKKELKGIKKITRQSPYKVKRAAKTENQRTNEGEQWFVLDLFWQNTDKRQVFGDLPEFGYQIPLKDSMQNTEVGEIDFISVMPDGYLYLHEIKADYSSESILKAILQVQTYYQILDHNKLIKDFELNVKGVKKSIVIFKSSTAYTQINEEKVKELLDLFDIKLIVLSNSNIFTQIN